KVEWNLEEKEDLSEVKAKADAAIVMVKLNNQATEAKASGDDQTLMKHSLAIIALDKWKNKDWLLKSPILQEYLNNAHAMVNNAHAMVEDVHYRTMLSYNEQKQWTDLKKDYSSYEGYCKKYAIPVSDRITKLIAAADKELSQIISDNVECGKKKFLEESYDEAMTCLKTASMWVKKHPELKYDTDQLDYVTQSTEQAIRILKDIEEERQKERQQMAEAERLRIEEANRIVAEAEAKIEAERRIAEEEKIKLAQAAEKEKLRKLEEERRIEAERKRQIEEQDRRFRAFLKKGAPVKPLVTTVMRPSYGIGDLRIEKTQKWQGGSLLPKPKDKSIASEDVYALEIEVPKTHKLTYLKNYYEKSSVEKNMLSAPRTQGESRSYYTENFKGGRYYLDVKNEKSETPKYELKARIYKIPVTN
ncbi:hypothetical protein KKA14_01585, partial [bacterium]|nr:hypothetical protein [bacterium]